MSRKQEAKRVHVTCTFLNDLFHSTNLCLGWTETYLFLWLRHLQLWFIQIGVVSKPARQVPEAGEAVAEGALQHLKHGRGRRLHAVQQPGQLITLVSERKDARLYLVLQRRSAVCTLHTSCLTTSQFSCLTLLVPVIATEQSGPIVIYTGNGNILQQCMLISRFLST